MNKEVPPTTEVPAETPDPRLNGEDKASLAMVLSDLDETERHRCVILARRYVRFFRTSANFDPDMLPTLWSSAHDRAIVETAAARASAPAAGKAEWDDRTWRDPK